jgi:hypothetical protein
MEYQATEECNALQARAVFLASSPRQREADTGAPMLAYLYISLDCEIEPIDCLRKYPHTKKFVIRLFL